MKILLSVLVFSFTNVLYASEDPYSLPITRDNVTHTMIAYNFWSGEYPSPVIDVQVKQKKWLKIKGYKSLRKLTQPKNCTIKTGIYHPWSKDKISVINYYSIIPKVDYLAKKATIFDEKKFKKGDKLKHEVYLSEGFCSYDLNNKKRFESTCIGKMKPFERTEYPSHAAEQWLYLSCKEGHKVFVQDNDLLSQPHVKKGKIAAYGEVTHK